MIGMLWRIDITKKSVDENLQEALAYFENKYKKPPKIVNVHRSQFGLVTPIEGISIMPSEAQFGHFLIFPEESTDGVS